MGMEQLVEWIGHNWQGAAAMVVLYVVALLVKRGVVTREQVDVATGFVASLVRALRAPQIDDPNEIVLAIIDSRKSTLGRELTDAEVKAIEEQVGVLLGVDMG